MYEAFKHTHTDMHMYTYDVAECGKKFRGIRQQKVAA